MTIDLRKMVCREYEKHPCSAEHRLTFLKKMILKELVKDYESSL